MTADDTAVTASTEGRRRAPELIAELQSVKALPILTRLRPFIQEVIDELDRLATLDVPPPSAKEPCAECHKIGNLPLVASSAGAGDYSLTASVEAAIDKAGEFERRLPSAKERAWDALVLQVGDAVDPANPRYVRISVLRDLTRRLIAEAAPALPAERCTPERHWFTVDWSRTICDCGEVQRVATAPGVPAPPTTPLDSRHMSTSEAKDAADAFERLKAPAPPATPDDDEAVSPFKPLPGVPVAHSRSQQKRLEAQGVPAPHFVTGMSTVEMTPDEPTLAEKARSNASYIRAANRSGSPCDTVETEIFAKTLDECAEALTPSEPPIPARQMLDTALHSAGAYQVYDRADSVEDGVTAERLIDLLAPVVSAWAGRPGEHKESGR